VPDQRRRSTKCTGLDLTDEEHVVAGWMQCVVSTFEPCHRAFDQGRPGRAQTEVDAGETIRVRARKPAREIDLVIGQHADCVARGAFERGEAARMPRQAPGDQRWIQRHRIERVGREADELTGPKRRGNDRDSRGELRHGVAKSPLGAGGRRSRDGHR
jgi:hypothetical protein